MRPCVLSGIRPSFPGLSQSAGQITHVLLTRSPLIHTRRCFSVRLACVKHAASVRPEPGSNSPTMTVENNPSRHSNNPTGPERHTQRNHQTPQTTIKAVHEIQGHTIYTNLNHRHAVEFSKNTPTPSPRPHFQAAKLRGAFPLACVHHSSRPDFRRFQGGRPFPFPTALTERALHLSCQHQSSYQSSFVFQGRPLYHPKAGAWFATPVSARSVSPSGPFRADKRKSTAP